MRKGLFTMVVALMILTVVGSTALGQTSPDVEVAVTPERIDTVLGNSFDIEVIVSNMSDQPTAPLVAHIDITDPTSSTSVDPEDWTETLSQEIGILTTGQTRSVIWTLQPISPGRFSLYAVALSPGAPDVYASGSTIVEVAFVQTLNPEGVLPIVIAGPVVIGALLVLILRRSARPSGHREVEAPI